MNNTTVISPVTENGPLVQEIPLDRIVESKTNPRRVFDERKLRELAANVKDHGVLQPVLVRPHPAGDDGLFELVVVMCRSPLCVLCPSDLLTDSRKGRVTLPRPAQHNRPNPR